MHDARVLCVIKKNGPRLRKLLRWANRADDSVLRSCPLLVIDDEADQASINTSSDDDPSIINDLIRQLLAMFPRSAYVGYTATPFAMCSSDRNADDDDLYPRDFIVDLPRPDSYFGAERIFGRDRLPKDPTGLTMKVSTLFASSPTKILKSSRAGGKRAKNSSRQSRHQLKPRCTTSGLRRPRVVGGAAGAPQQHVDPHDDVRQHPEQDGQSAPLAAFRDPQALERPGYGIRSGIEDQWDDEQRRVPSTLVGERPFHLKPCARTLQTY